MNKWLLRINYNENVGNKVKLSRFYRANIDLIFVFSSQTNNTQKYKNYTQSNQVKRIY